MVPEFSDICVPDCIPTHTEIPVREVEKYRYRYTEILKNVGICVDRYLTRGLAQGVIEKMKMKRVNSDNLSFS